jgi:hypothetical protein
MPNLICLIDLVHISETKIISGEKKVNGEWVRIENQIVPKDVTVRTGSVIEKSDAQAKFGIKQGWYAPVGKQLNTNLESIFGQTVEFGKGNQATLANVLRSYRINSLEQVAENAEGRIPFSDGKQKGGQIIHVKEIFGLHGIDNDQATMFIEMAQQAIKEK